MEFLKPKTSCKTSCFFLNDAMFWRFFWKNIDVDVFDDVLQNAKHRANDASNDVNRPPLPPAGNQLCCQRSFGLPCSFYSHHFPQTLVGLNFNLIIMKVTFCWSQASRQGSYLRDCAWPSLRRRLKTLHPQEKDLELSAKAGLDDYSSLHCQGIDRVLVPLTKIDLDGWLPSPYFHFPPEVLAANFLGRYLHKIWVKSSMSE